MSEWSLGEQKDGKGYPLFADDRFVGWITGWPQQRDELMEALQAAQRQDGAGEEISRSLLAIIARVDFARNPIIMASEREQALADVRSALCSLQALAQPARGEVEPETTWTEGALIDNRLGPNFGKVMICRSCGRPRDAKHTDCV